MSFPKQILLFSTQIFCVVCFAQTVTIDSLQKILPSLKDTARIDCLNALSEASIYLKPDTAKMYAVKAYSEALKINYLRGIAKSFSNRGYIEAKGLGRLPIAENYARQAIELYEKTNDTKGLVEAYIIWSFSLMVQGFYDSSINGCIKTIQLCKKINYKANEARATNMIGINYLGIGNYTKAFEYIMEGLRVSKESKDSDRLTISLAYAGNLYRYASDLKTALAYYFESLHYAKGSILLQHPLIDIGDVYFLQKRYDSALFYYRQYIDTIKSITTDSAIRHGYTMDGLRSVGEIFLAKKEYDEALTYFKEPLNYSRNVNNQGETMRILLDKARIYYYKKDYKTALYYAKESLAIAWKIKAKQSIRDDNELMFKIYDELKQTDSAYIHYKQYMDMKDSVALEAFNRKMDLYKAASEDEKKQAQIKKLNNEKLINQQQLKIQQQQLKSESLLRNILIACMFASLLLGIFIFRNILLKRKNERLQNEAKQAEMQRLTVNLELQALRAQMNPHFIFNCLNSINRFIINNDAPKAADYLTKFARLIRIVLEQSGKPFITLEDEICWLKLYMELEALRFEKPFQYEINYKDIDITTIMIPTMLIQPFVENAIWHGLHPKQNGVGEININMHQDDSILHCSIKDNGVGIGNSSEKNQVNKKSLGMQLTQQRLQLADNNQHELLKIKTEQLKTADGQINGTCVYINIPYKND